MSNEETERGFTASPAVPGQSQSRASKKEFEAFLESPAIDPNTDNKTQQSIRESIEILSDAYWRQFESGENEERWDWRKHAYIAWSCVPKSMRYPKTLEEFADFVGLSNTSTIRKWRSKDPDIATRITTLPKLLLNRHVADVLNALATVAADPVPQAHQDRKLFLEIAGVHNPKSDVNLRGVVGTVELDDPLSDEEQERIERILKEVAAQK